MQPKPERSCQTENVCESRTVSVEMTQQADSCLCHEFTVTQNSTLLNGRKISASFLLQKKKKEYFLNDFQDLFFHA